MDLHQIAGALATHCREGTERAALETLYADDAVAVEASDQGQGRETQGKAGISGKHDWFDANFDVHEAEVLGPFPHPAVGDVPDRFALIFRLKATFKMTGETSDMEEVGIYTVVGGKIVREEFFYGPE